MAQIHAKTETAVGNEALTHLLCEPIADLDSDTSLKGRTLRLHFAPVRDALLRDYYWNFAEVYKTIQKDPAFTPPFKFRYAYVLPADCLKARRIEDCHDRRDWKVSGRRIFSNVGPSINLIYGRNETDVAKWDAQFRLTFSLSLAEACRLLCKDAKTVQQVTASAQDARARAQDSDKEEGEPDELPEQDVIAARC